MKIAAIHAHPDDIEFLCAGTLALAKQQGHDIFIATMTPGDKGAMETGPEVTAQIRREEARRSAETLGAKYACLEFPDFEIFDNDDGRRRVTEYLRSIAPDIVLTSSPQDYHADHEATGTLVRHAAFVVGLPNFKTGEAPTMKAPPAVYYMDPTEGKDIYGQPIQPEFMVNVSAVMEIKKAMLACHESQREWLRKYHGMDNYIDELVKWTRARGEAFGVPFGEGFRQHKGHAYPQENRLAQCLPEGAVVSA